MVVAASFLRILNVIAVFDCDCFVSVNNNSNQTARWGKSVATKKRTVEVAEEIVDMPEGAAV